MSSAYQRKNLVSCQLVNYCVRWSCWCESECGMWSRHTGRKIPGTVQTILVWVAYYTHFRDSGCGQFVIIVHIKSSHNEWISIIRYPLIRLQSQRNIKRMRGFRGSLQWHAFNAARCRLRLSFWVTEHDRSRQWALLIAGCLNHRW